MPLMLSRDESRALAFVGLLLAVSAAARLLDRPARLELDAPATDLAELEAASRARQEAGAKLRPGERLDPNTATVAELVRLPGASRSIAERVVAERQASPFRTAEDLQRVRGVGPATVERWREYLALPAAAPAALAASRGASGRDAGKVEAASAPIDLNRASAAELERLPGVGPVLAARIVAWRDSVGRFERVEQLETVRGIGPAMMSRLGPLVRVGS